MMNKQRYDIFVSYRRTSFDTANLIATKLQMAGYSVFLDVETLRSGKFNERLFQVIEECKDFILVLPPNALDRCSDKDDWVRLEIEYAIKCGKNIIPVMLRGFEWPNVESLPESLRELHNYNAITAADPNVFVENIERLKNNFLRSRPKVVSWQKYRMAIYLLLAIVIGVICYLMLGRTSGADTTSATVATHDTVLYEQTCADYACRLLAEYAKCDLNMSILDSAYEDFEKFVENINKTDAESQIAEFERCIEQYRKSLMQPEAVVVAECDVAILRNGGFKIANISSHNLEFKDAFDNYNRDLDVLISYSQDSNVKHLLEFVKNNNYSTQCVLELTYYSLLHTISEMPESVYDEIYKMFSSLRYFSNVPLRLSGEEYERMADVALNKMEEAIRKMSVHINNDTVRGAELDECVARIEMAEAAFDASYNKLEVLNICIDMNDTEESARQKIETYDSIVREFCMNSKELVDSYFEYNTLTGTDDSNTRAIESQLSSTINNLYSDRGYMVLSFESRWGKYE